jgi:hypothetical protein
MIGVISLPEETRRTFPGETPLGLGLRPIIPCPPGRALLVWGCSRHFVPGYDRTVPPGLSPFAFGAASHPEHSLNTLPKGVSQQIVTSLLVLAAHSQTAFSVE